MKILINRNRIAVMQFERTLKEEQPLYNQAVDILNGTGLLLEDDDLLTKLALFYTKSLDLGSDAKIIPQLELVGKTHEYFTVKSVFEKLTFPLDVYTSDGKQIYIEDTFFEYAETDEEINMYKELKDVSERLLALEIKRPAIKETLRPFVFDWNPYDQSEILIKKHHLIEGIQGRKDREKSRIHHIEQAKRIKEKQLAKT